MPRKRKTEAERIAEALTTAADYIRTQTTAAQTAQPTAENRKRRNPKRSEAQRRADAAYREKNRKNQKENYKNIAATFPKAEAEAIAAIIKAHGVKPAEVIRATAHGLTSGTQTAEAIRQAAQAWTDSQHQPATSPTDNPDGGNE